MIRHHLSRRNFLQLSALTTGSVFLAACAPAAAPAAPASSSEAGGRCQW